MKFSTRMNERGPAAIMARPRRLSGAGPVMATRLTARAQQIVHRLIALTAVGAVSFLLCTPAISQAVTSTSSADAVGQFYKGKQITFVVGAAVGGGYDTLARLMARHLGKHIPGNPHFVVQNIPAANSLVAANNLYNILPKDGTYIGLLIRNILMAPVTKPSGARFEIEKFNWVGSLASENSVALAWQTAPTKTLQDLFQRELIVGGMSGVDPETTPLIYNALIGTKFKIVNGYNGTTDIALAMERREVDGIGDWSWSSLKMSKPDWLKDQRVHILLQGALTRNPELPNVPFALDYVKGDLDRQVFRLYFAQKEAARPVVAPPGIPPERLQALRAGFMQMALDSEFQNDAEKSKLLVDPAPGSSVQDIVSMIASAPGPVAKRLLDILSPSR